MHETDLLNHHHNQTSSFATLSVTRWNVSNVKSARSASALYGGTAQVENLLEDFTVTTFGNSEWGKNTLEDGSYDHPCD